MKSLNTKISLAGMTSFLLVAAALLGFSSVIPTVTATTATATPPVTAATDNESVNVLISWEPTEIEPEQDTEFTLDFQDPSSGDSIPHVNYNFEVIGENDGETIESMTDLHTHSGSDEQTVTFDNTGSFNFVVTIIGTGIDPPFDTTQSGTAETIIAVGQEEEPSPVAPDDNDTEAATATTTDDDDDDTTTTTTTSPQAGMIELSPQPVYQERQITVSENPINQTHIQLTISGNGTLTLPNTTETISTTSTGSLIVSLDGTGAGKEVITTEDGSESVTATIYAIARFGMEGGRGIIITLLDTDSTGRLAPLDGMILAGQIEFPPPPEEAALITLWEWQSGIPLGQNQFADIVVPPPSPTTAEEPSLTDTTTTMTNATTDDTTATTALPEQGEGEEQQQTTTIPPTPLLE